MIKNLFKILNAIEDFKNSISPEILEKAKNLEVEDFVEYGDELLNFTGIVNDNDRNFRPLFYIHKETLKIGHMCTCSHVSENKMCSHIAALIFTIENNLKNKGKFNDDYHLEVNIDEYLGINDYGDTYYLIYPENPYTYVKLGRLKEKRVVLRKDIDTYKKILSFLKTKIPEDENDIKKLLVPIHINGTSEYKLILKNFKELKKIKSKKILLKNKKKIVWNDDIKFKLYVSGNIKENISTIKLLPELNKRNIVSTYDDYAYFENNTLSLIKSKTNILFPYYGPIETHVKFKNKNGLEIFIKDNLIKYEKYGFEIEIDENLGIKKDIFIPKLNLYINFINDRFYLKGKFLYGTEIEFYNDYKYRNYDEENRLLNSLKNAGIELDEKGKGTLDIDSFFEFIDNKIRSLDKNIIIKMNKNIKRQEIESIQMKLNLKNNWFDVEGEITLKDNKKIDINILRNRKDNFIVLKDDTIIKIPEKILEKLEDLKFKKNKVEIESYNIYSFLNNPNLELESLDKKTKSFIEKIKNFEKIKEYEIPELKSSMRDYQIQGYYFLRYLQEFNFNGILADDMGLGKTVQTIALILSLKEKNRKFLIITPRSVVYNWAYEIEKFTSNLKYYIYHNNQKDIPDDVDVILTTYGTIRNSIDNFKKMKLFYIILDEAQYIKNHETKLYSAIKKLKASHKLALTGTPLENSLNDLYNIFDFLMPGFFGKRKEFLRKYNYANKDSIERLKKKINPFILRRKKENVLKELPPKTEEYIFNEMTQHQTKIYHQILEEYKQKIAISQGTLNFSVLEGLLRLRQVVNHPKLLGINIESSKFNEFKKFVLEVLGENHKIVVFSQFVKMINIMEDWLKEEIIKYNKITGQTKKRVDIINEFNSDNNIKILLVSLKAGGTGLNITGADYVIHYDPWWNPAVENQATDRVYRIGQTKPVFVYKFITKNSIEEKILKLKNAKKDLYNLAITEEKSLLKNLTKEDIMQLFE
ncbi:DEAD/DEAH box helicase [Marinitoga aeolica]|uniref:SNF2 helicase associated domain-containing protein n=1 Tax=Marinitoga aeolica TaxID=2809031 RepID=A0ABY8PT08_9BACT|nr:DEAD/DEAH box helicase [Marinitoga aeolica]WGS65766.1 SNF2 helicase associated domain-containing protein [Marinitoga aeolica]